MNGVLLPFAAVAAGVVSATSPCVLPVLPGYIAAVAASTGPDDARRTRARIVGALGFVAGFTTVFTILGATASAVGRLLFDELGTMLRLAGLVLIVFGLHSLGLLRVPLLLRERRPIELHRVGSGPRRSVALGAAFALGWTPCIGPVLATILTKAGADASLIGGMSLLLLYSLGLGLPFIGVAVWFERSKRLQRWMMSRSNALQRIAGVTMVAAGIGYLTGIWATIFSGLQGWLARTGWPPI